MIDLLARFGDSDLDQDGIWDSQDDCVGAYDTCGVCNGPGPQVLAIDTIVITFDSIYVDAIDEWLTYELSRDTLLHLVCENPGCTNPLADNFDPYAEEGGICTYLSCDGPNHQGYSYQAVEIGTQCWFAENLRATTYLNGDSIPVSMDLYSDWGLLETGALTYYINPWSDLSSWGPLYNGFAVLDSRGLCPIGWHIPSQDDWTILKDYVVEEFGLYSEALVLKSSTDWNGTDDFGFGAQPGGWRYPAGGTDTGGYHGYWWGSTQNEQGGLYKIHMETQPNWWYDGWYSLNTGISIRCLRDSE